MVVMDYWEQAYLVQDRLEVRRGVASEYMVTLVLELVSHWSVFSTILWLEPQEEWRA
jgi:hypothetical protein